MRLIINADDFGLSAGVTYGIFDAMQRGVVTSTTMMVTGEAANLAARLAKEYGLSVGLHLNISFGVPLTDALSLTEHGRFIKPAVLGTDERYDEDELFGEFEAQYERFLSLVGAKPTHIDSHLYAHQKLAKVQRQAVRLADKYGLPLRAVSTARYPATEFVGTFKAAAGDTVQALCGKLTKIISSIEDSEKVVELMVHPGFIDNFVLDNSSYNLQRQIEHGALTDGEIVSKIKNNEKINLIGFGEVRENG